MGSSSIYSESLSHELLIREHASPLITELNWTETFVQFCPTLCDPYSSPGSYVLGMLQARILEWGAIPFSSEPSWPRDQTQASGIAGRVFTVWATTEALSSHNLHPHMRKVIGGKQEFKGAQMPWCAPDHPVDEKIWFGQRESVRGHKRNKT